LTFCSAVNVIEHVGATPVLVDVNPNTLNVDVDHLAAVISELPVPPAVLMPVHYGGLPCDLDRIAKIARDVGAAILEDAAHAFGASWNGHPIGATLDHGVGTLTAFSFYATKNLTTAEGGMVVGPTELINRARELALHGLGRAAWNRYQASGTWFHEVVEPGFKFNLPDVLAAIGLVQLRRFPHLQHRRAQIVSQYRQAFTDRAPQLLLPDQGPDNVVHAWHLFPVRLWPGCSVNRDDLITRLARRGIGTSVHFIPIHLHSYYRNRYGWKPQDFPVAYDAYKNLLSLPLHPSMTDADVARVVDALCQELRQ
jgi:dTDP-4-amino-4,6-dideoxygalactose transaminase